MRHKAYGVVAAASALTLFGGGIALADNVVNNVTVGGTDTITAGGSTSVQYKINATGGDGQKGCNASDGSAATLTITAPAGVTATPSSLTFTACNVDQSVTFTSTSVGNHNITHAVTDSGTGTYSNQANWTLKVNAPADSTAPVLTLPTDITAEATSASGAVVTYSASATDNVDGAITPSCTPTSGSTFALGQNTVNCSATDAAGNTASGSFKVTVWDTTAPTNITFSTTGVQDGGSYLRNFVPAAPTCAATDLVTAVPTCVVTGYSNAAGTHTLTATATDAAGNSSTATMSYTVRTLTISAFGSPVDGNGVLNAIKGGNTVPLKFTVKDGTTERTDTAVVSGFSAAKVSCTTAATDEIEEFSTTGSTSLRYDNGQFIQNWKTPTGAGNCYKATVTTIDGSSQSALFKLK